MSEKLGTPISRQRVNRAKRAQIRPSGHSGAPNGSAQLFVNYHSIE